MNYKDYSDKPTLPDNIDEFLNNNPVYYVSDYPLNELSHVTCAGKDYIPDDTVREYYNTLDYRMINHVDNPNRVIHGLSDAFNFVVTSIDTKGIQSPLNMNHENNVHPGNKRLLCARYLDLDTIPVVVDIGKELDRGTRLNKLQDIYDIYGTDISIKIDYRFRRECLSVSWHGDTKIRNQNGDDDWNSASSRRENFFSVREYLVENGLEVVNSEIHKTVTNGSVVTHFRTSQQNKIGVEIHDTNLLKMNLDFWELFFHIDPLVSAKTCVTSKLSIYNNFANKNVINNCSLYKTLIRHIK